MTNIMMSDYAAYLFVREVHESVSKVFVVNLNADDGGWCLPGTLALEDSVGRGHLKLSKMK